MAMIRSLRRAGFACVLSLAAALGACTTVTVTPAPGDLTAAVSEARKALDSAQSARRVALYQAARGNWRAAARAVDEIMFSLGDARRIRAAVADVDKAADAERGRSAETLREAQAAVERLTVADGRVAPPRAHVQLVASDDSGCDGTCAGSALYGTPPFPASPQLAAALAERRQAHEALAAAEKTADRTAKALGEIDAAVGTMKGIAEDARRIDGSTAPAAPSAAPPSPDLYTTPTLAPPPDTGFDQDVPNAQQ